MVTIEKLKAWGANTDDGLKRCMNNEDFYLKMVSFAIANDGFDKLEDALNKGDLEAGFETAHALKGVLANLSLTPLQDVVSEMTELLRAGTQTDYTPLITKMRSLYEELKEM